MVDNEVPRRSRSHAPGFEGYDIGRVTVGQFYGLRAFHMERGGLFGITYPQEWQPGTNIAECYNDMRTRTPGEHMAISRWRPGPGLVPYPCPAPVKPGPGEPGHDMGPCSCGYWAFHDTPSAEWYMSRDSRVGGVIQLAGTVKAGSRGWRASRARIVALIQPRVEGYDEDSWDQIQWRFHVPVYATAEAAIADWPPTVPDRWMLYGSEG